MLSINYNIRTATMIATSYINLIVIKSNNLMNYNVIIINIMINKRCKTIVNESECECVSV